MSPGCSWKCVQEERLPHGESSMLPGLSRGLPFLASASLFNFLVWMAGVDLPNSSGILLEDLFKRSLFLKFVLLFFLMLSLGYECSTGLFWLLWVPTDCRKKEDLLVDVGKFDVLLIDGRTIFKDVSLAWSWSINNNQIREQGLCLSLYDLLQTGNHNVMADVGLKMKGLSRVDLSDVYF